MTFLDVIEAISTQFNLIMVVMTLILLLLLAYTYCGYLKYKSEYQVLQNQTLVFRVGLPELEGQEKIKNIRAKFQEGISTEAQETLKELISINGEVIRNMAALAELQDYEANNAALKAKIEALQRENDALQIKQ